VARAVTSVQLPALTDRIVSKVTERPFEPVPGLTPVGPGLSAEQPAMSPAAAIAARATIRFNVRRIGASLVVGMFALRIRILLRRAVEHEDV
jgi:hypothetical protein